MTTGTSSPSIQRHMSTRSAETMVTMRRCLGLSSRVFSQLTRVPAGLPKSFSGVSTSFSSPCFSRPSSSPMDRASAAGASSFLAWATWVGSTGSVGLFFDSTGWRRWWSPSVYWKGNDSALPACSSVTLPWFEFSRSSFCSDRPSWRFANCAKGNGHVGPSTSVSASSSA